MLYAGLPLSGARLGSLLVRHCTAMLPIQAQLRLRGTLSEHTAQEALYCSQQMPHSRNAPQEPQR